MPMASATTLNRWITSYSTIGVQANGGSTVTDKGVSGMIPL